MIYVLIYVLFYVLLFYFLFQYCRSWLEKVGSKQLWWRSLSSSTTNGGSKADSDHLPDLTECIYKNSSYPISHGSFGDVWKCAYIASDRHLEVAVKSLTIDVTDDDSKARITQRLLNDFRARKELQHENILLLLGFTDGFGPLPSMVSPWMHNGSLTTYLKRNFTKLTIEPKLRILRQVAAGISYLHSKGIVHGDLSANNILLDSNHNAYVANHGILTTYYEFPGTISYIRRNVRWAAPELFELAEDEESWPLPKAAGDVYSFGCIMLQVMTGRPPYADLRSDHQVAVSILLGKKPTRPSSPHIPDSFWDFIEKCWSNAEHRPSATKVLSFLGSDCLVEDFGPFLAFVSFQTHHLHNMRRSIKSETRPPVEKTIDGMLPLAPDRPVIYDLRELPNEVITAYEYHGTAAGGLGDIWQCGWSKNSEKTEVAVTSIRVRHTNDGDEVDQITRMITQEAVAWARSSHDNILPLYSIIPYFRPLPAFMTPWMANGSLTDYLQREFSCLSATRKIDILNQVVAGLKHLHDDGIAHDSLTSDDVFLDGSGRVYLAHFGRLSKIFARAQTPMSGATNPLELRYIAPEFLAPVADAGASRSSKAGDIYSFGCVMIQVLSGKIPYEWIHDSSKVLQKEYTNETHWTFGQQCLSVESEDRPSIEDVFCFFVVQSIGAVDLTNSVIRNNRYPVSCGGYADVHKCQLTLDSMTVLGQQAVSSNQVPLDRVDVAVKALRPMGVIETPRIVKRLFREIKISSTLRHENIVPLLGVTRQFGVFPALVSPWIRNGTLTEYLQDNHEKLSYGKKFALLRDVARGLQYLHSQSIVHGDLSGSNVLVDEDGKARLTDFGLSALLSGRASQALLPSVAGGTLLWTAPEHLMSDDSNMPSVFSQTSDVYSFGGIMLQVLEGKVPYHYITSKAIIIQISRGITPRRPSTPVIIDGDWDFIQRCWSLDAASRPPGTELVTFMEGRATIDVCK
ncbi:kinase-like domain-containing protein [Suillus ampliporus]|nr:kinase-like domain-containing protein [Suillus ampliporus]